MPGDLQLQLLHGQLVRHARDLQRIASAGAGRHGDEQRSLLVRAEEGLARRGHDEHGRRLLQGGVQGGV